jgi:hypothetical protein
VAATLLILGLVFGSWGTVYAAQDSLPNDFLYPVKLAGENLQLAFIRDAEARISLLTDLAGRRVAEAEALTLQGQPVPDELTDLLDGYLQELLALTLGMDDDTRQVVLEGVYQRLRPRDQDNRPEPGDGNPLFAEWQHQLQKKFGQTTEEPPMLITDALTMTVPVTRTIPPGPGITTTRIITPPRHGITTTLIITPPGHGITTTLVITPPRHGITTTLIITPGLYGPGQCYGDPDECAPAGYQDPFGPHEGTTPEPGDRGQAPGPDESEGPQQPLETPKPDPVDVEPPKGTPVPDDDGNDPGGGSDNGSEGGSSKGGEP